METLKVRHNLSKNKLILVKRWNTGVKWNRGDKKDTFLRPIWNKPLKQINWLSDIFLETNPTWIGNKKGFIASDIEI